MKELSGLARGIFHDPIKRWIFCLIFGALSFAILWYWNWICFEPTVQVPCHSHKEGQHPEENFSAHLVAVFLELLLVMFLIEGLWRENERSHEEQERQQQLRLIKSYMFHGHMFNLFWENFRAISTSKDGAPLKSKGVITFLEILETKDPNKWKDLEEQCSHITYANPESTAKAFMEYVNAEETVWKRFVELAVLFNFPLIIADMAEIQGCTARAKRIIPDIAKSLGETLPKDKPEGTLTENGVILFLRNYPASEGPYRKDLPPEEQLARDIRLILRKGIEKFMEYAKELQGFKPEKPKKEMNQNQNAFDLLMMPYVKKEESHRGTGAASHRN